jgi:hypothetical protein
MIFHFLPVHMAKELRLSPDVNLEVASHVIMN